MRSSQHILLDIGKQSINCGMDRARRTKKKDDLLEGLKEARKGGVSRLDLLDVSISD